MSESQRVLSGSVIRGSSATLTGSVQYFYQGINANTLTSYVGSLLPRMGSGDRLEIQRNGSPLSKKTYDDSITINNDLKDIGGGSDASQHIRETVVFPLERLAFGQPPSTVRDEPFADMTSFNPVTYIQDQNEFMWPVNLWNLGSLPDHEYDGIIEPLDIRKEALGHSDLRYEGRTIRGALVGAASERPWGSIEISDTWSINEPSPYAFLDSPLFISSSAGSTSTPVYTTQNWLTASFVTGSHTYTSNTASKLHLWGNLASAPDDRSPDNVTMTAIGTEGVDYNITSGPTVGTREHEIWNYAGSSTSGYDYGLPSYWDNKIGFGAMTAASAPAVGTSTFSFAMWVKIDAALATTSTSAEFMAMGQDIDGNNLSQIKLDYNNGDTGIGITKPYSYSNRLRIEIKGGDYLTNNKKVTSRFVTNDWDYLHDQQWHHIAVTAVITQGDTALGSGVPGGASVSVAMYVDGVAKTSLLATSGTSFSGAYDAQSQMRLVDVDIGGHAGKTRLFHSMTNTNQFKGSAASPLIWGSLLTADEVEAVYLLEKNKAVVKYNITHHNNPSKEINPLAIQAYQDIRQSSLNPLRETDYHDKVYSSIISHNDEDMRSALRLLNSSSCDSFTDPLQKTATRGVSLDGSAGSITFNNILVVGEY